MSYEIQKNWKFALLMLAIYGISITVAVWLWAVFIRWAVGW